MREDLRVFLKLYFKCFLILIIMGEILPTILEKILEMVYCKPRIYDNSILVIGQAPLLLRVLRRYVYLFSLILR